MAKRDYYEILGVSKNATQDEIKKSFRQKARHLHPDNKDSGDEAAFKELAEAYEVLSDEQKRATFNRYGHEGVKGSTRGFDNVDFSNFSGFGIDDIIDMFFGQGRGGGGGGGARTPGGPEQGSHLKLDLEIDFLEAVFGTEKKVNVRRLEECTSCQGSGAQPGYTPTTCATCGGVGQVKQLVNMLFAQTYQVIECPACQGSGKKIDKPCRDCSGHGLTRKSRDFDVKIPPGIEAGSRMRLASGGDRGRRGGPYGDLFIVIHVKEHKQFVRDGINIHIRQPIGFALAGLGGEISVPTVDGDKTLKIPAGVQSGTTIVMKELGVPRFNSPQRRGDQIVHVVVETPTRLSSQEKKILADFAALRGEKLEVEVKPSDTKEQEKDTDKVKEKESNKESNKDESGNGNNEKTVESEKSNSKGKSGNNKKDKKHDKHKSSHAQKEDGSILDKIVDAFKPRGDDEK